MAEIVGERTIDVRGKKTKFTAKKLKDGTLAFYRDGRRAVTAYQRRVAKGVVEGKTLAEASGRATAGFDKQWREKFYGRREINEFLARFYGERSKSPGQGAYGTSGHKDGGHEVSWAAPPMAPSGAFDRHRYYALVNVQLGDDQGAGSDLTPVNEGDVCAPATLALYLERPGERGGILTGVTRAEFRRHFLDMLFAALRRANRRLCTGEPKTDVLGIWKHVAK